MSKQEEFKADDCEVCPFYNEDGFCNYYEDHIDDDEKKPKYCKVTKVIVLLWDE